MATSPNSLSRAQRALLPCDKHDQDAVATLDKLDSASLMPLLPEILAWLQDLNWPVAKPVLQLMRKHLPLLIDPVRDILRGDDDPWKSNCLEYLVREMPREQQSELIPELQRLVIHPTPGEMEEEAHLTAEDILEHLQNLG
ncbi:hypothetical protein EG329_011186 [Mollisiaceae sp. DMI_Dod_QoI]|nr:hypothetical protein EG329_011186 [Helotiales sp. DMI_Dod_QoI]